MGIIYTPLFFPIQGLKRKKRPFQRALNFFCPRAIHWDFFLGHLRVYWFRRTKNIAMRTFVPQILYNDQTNNVLGVEIEFVWQLGFFLHCCVYCKNELVNLFFVIVELQLLKWLSLQTLLFFFFENLKPILKSKTNSKIWNF